MLHRVFSVSITQKRYKKQTSIIGTSNRTKLSEFLEVYLMIYSFQQKTTTTT